MAADAGAMESIAKQGRLLAPPAPSAGRFTLCSAPCTPQPSQARLPNHIKQYSRRPCTRCAAKLWGVTAKQTVALVHTCSAETSLSSA